MKRPTPLHRRQLQLDRCSSRTGFMRARLLQHEWVGGIIAFLSLVCVGCPVPVAPPSAPTAFAGHLLQGLAWDLLLLLLLLLRAEGFCGSGEGTSCGGKVGKLVLVGVIGAPIVVFLLFVFFLTLFFFSLGLIVLYRVLAVYYATGVVCGRHKLTVVALFVSRTLARSLQRRRCNWLHLQRLALSSELSPQKRKLRLLLLYPLSEGLFLCINLSLSLRLLFRLDLLFFSPCLLFLPSLRLDNRHGFAIASLLPYLLFSTLANLHNSQLSLPLLLFFFVCSFGHRRRYGCRTSTAGSRTRTRGQP